VARLAAATLVMLVMHAAPAAAVCEDAIKRDGAWYAGASTHRSVDLGGVRKAIRPGCDDFIVVGPDGRRQNPPPPDQEIKVRRISGVHPDVALAASRRRVYLAAGYLPELRSHPLHRAVWRRGDLPRKRVCREVVASATLKSQPGFGRVLRVAGRDVDLRADTRYSGRHRHGLPYLRSGDRVTVRGCPQRREGRRAIVAALVRQRRVSS
jgi:hypothetical protein